MTLRDAASRMWDVIIIGAGPAGGGSAFLLASAGLSVLLVDRATFPRDKVCGCCINASAIGSLEAMGLRDVLDACGARVLHGIHLRGRRNRAELNIPAGVSLSRKALDQAIISRAVQAGAAFLPQTSAKLGAVQRDHREVLLSRGGESCTVTARLVLAADGLGGRLMEEAQLTAPQVAAHSHMGLAAIMDQPHVSTNDAYGDGVITMACGHGGYVGAVRLEDGRLNIAAAIAPHFVRSAGGPAAAAALILQQANAPAIPDLHEAHWQGTPLLTRSRAQPAAPRLFALGDAAGYVEPITGEGIAWALAGALAVRELALRAVERWDDAMITEWTLAHRAVVKRRQWFCRLVSQTLRSPLLTRGMIAAARCWPGITGRLLHSAYSLRQGGQLKWA